MSNSKSDNIFWKMIRDQKKNIINIIILNNYKIN